MVAKKIIKYDLLKGFDNFCCPQAIQEQHLQCNAMLLVVYKVNSTRIPISNQ